MPNSQKTSNNGDGFIPGTPKTQEKRPLEQNDYQVNRNKAIVLLI
jgi:hypothetical protein